MNTVEISSVFKRREMTKKDEIQIEVTNYAKSFEILRKSTIKDYRVLFAELSGEGMPWNITGKTPEIHYKLKNEMHSMGIHNRLGHNHHFDQHLQASMARDCGSVEDAKAAYQKILKEKKLTEFKGDAVLFASENETTDVDDVLIDKRLIQLTLNATMVTQSKTHSGTLFLYQNKIEFHSQKKDVDIKMSTIKKIFFRKYL